MQNNWSYAWYWYCRCGGWFPRCPCWGRYAACCWCQVCQNKMHDVILLSSDLYVAVKTIKSWKMIDNTVHVVMNCLLELLRNTLQSEVLCCMGCVSNIFSACLQVCRKQHLWWKWRIPEVFHLLMTIVNMLMRNRL